MSGYMLNNIWGFLQVSKIYAHIQFEDIIYIYIYNSAFVTVENALPSFNIFFCGENSMLYGLAVKCICKV